MPIEIAIHVLAPKTINCIILFLPIFPSPNPGPVQSLKDDDPVIIDIGIYGPCLKKDYRKVELHKKMENFAIKMNGYQVRTLIVSQQNRIFFSSTISYRYG